MNSHGTLECVNIVDILYIEGGRSICFHLVDAEYPHRQMEAIFRNVFMCIFSRPTPDAYPITAIDMSWRKVPSSEKRALFTGVRFPFYNMDGSLLIPENTVYATHFEGDIVGDILSEEVSVFQALV